MLNDELGQLLEEHLPRLRAFVRLRTNQAIRDRESCSDLVQSVCREVLEGADRIDDQGKAAFRGWLFTTALRKIVERDRYLHRQKRDVGREVRAAPREEGAGDLGVLAAYATVTTPSMVLSAREQEDALEKAFDQLSDEYREVITLAKIGGLSHKEIAVHTGRTEEASRQLLRRAVVRLSMVLDREPNG